MPGAASIAALGAAATVTRIVAALGGHALLERGESPDADIRENPPGQCRDRSRHLIRQHEVR
jgi:hypothetical protein